MIDQGNKDRNIVLLFLNRVASVKISNRVTQIRITGWQATKVGQNKFAINNFAVPAGRQADANSGSIFLKGKDYASRMMLRYAFPRS